MYHFFIEPFQVDVAEKTVRILGEDVNHIKNVLRMKIGEEFTATVEEFLPKGREERDSMELSGQGKSYRCRIAGWGEDEILCSLCWEENCETELPSQVYLFQGLPKGDKMETIIQKNVELGVYQILPVAMSRCVVKLDAKKAQLYFTPSPYLFYTYNQIRMAFLHPFMLVLVQHFLLQNSHLLLILILNPRK